MQDGCPADFAERIKRLRAAHGVSQARLAAALGVSETTVVRWERGRRRPRRSSWRLIARAEAEGITDPAGLDETVPAARLNGRSRITTTPAGAQPPGDVTPQFGRERVLEWASAQLGAAGRGQGGIALITGDPGIGKTRILRHIATRARGQGWCVISGRGFEGMPPFFPIIEALREHFRVRDLEPLPPVLASATSDLAIAQPDQRTLITGSSPIVSVDGPNERLRVVQALSDVLASVAYRHAHVSDARRCECIASASGDIDSAADFVGGLLLVLDDLQWFDSGSLLLLEWLARRIRHMPALVLAAARTPERGHGQALAVTIAELRRERVLDRQTLGPLSREQTATLIEGVGGYAPAPAVADALYQETGGNPFFLEELVRSLVRHGRNLREPHALSGGYDVPDAVRDALAGRLSRLSQDANQALQALAVLGQDCSAELLTRLTGLETGPLLDALDEALAAGIAREDEYTIGFTCPLIQRTVFESLNLYRRRYLHLQAGRALEHLYERNLAPYVPALARHFREARSTDEKEKAITYTLKAGDAAVASYAWEHAAQHLEAALGMMAEQGVAIDQRAALLNRLGDLMFVSRLHWSKGIQWFEDAIRLYASMGLRAREAEARVRLGRYLSTYFDQQDVARAMQLYQSARSVLDQEPVGRAHAHLHIGLASAARFMLQPGDGLTAAQRAMGISERLGDAALHCEAAVWYADHLLLAGRLAEAFSLLHTTYEMASRHDATLAGLLAAWLGGNSCGMLGDPGDALAWYRRELEKPWLAGAPAQRRHSLSNMATFYVKAGDLVEARHCREEAGEISEALAARTSSALALGEGHWELAEQLMHDRQQRSPTWGNRSRQLSTLLTLIEATDARGDDAHTDALLRRVISVLEDGTLPLFEMRVRPRAAQFYAERGRLEEARHHLARCREIQAEGEDWRGIQVRVLLAEAAIARVEQRFETALNLCEQGLALARHYTLPWDEVEVLKLWGRALESAGEPERAIEKFNAATAVLQRIGAGERWVERVMAFAPPFDSHARFEERSAPARTNPAAVRAKALTHREIEVLRLVAEGRTNREIAETLSVSLNTVLRHMTHVLTKVGASNRTEAGAYALRHGILS